ncbi:winged helix-turn-helix transcriptional regulator [Nocardia sp. NPDC048505]|uniref:winged helix-turn-helix transcriptional regulator n=1 Tax=Nocardia sp. NPDC048505 TaxID=3155756 RepID=UPI0034063273
MATPRPGRPVRGSTTGRPLMAAFDLLGRRWTLRLIWELREGPVGARALLARCDGLSSSVLYQRLGELLEARLVVTTADGYALTSVGARLYTALDPLEEWAAAWAESASGTGD